jgi:hypothetical protein
LLLKGGMANKLTFPVDVVEIIIDSYVWHKEVISYKFLLRQFPTFLPV